MFRYSGRGFTLIELLVVIAIIGILSSVVLASLNEARAKANDTKRISDLQQVQKALELYYGTYGAYPNTSNSWRGSCPSFGSHSTTDANGWVPNLAPVYIPVLPLDPQPVNPHGCYLYRSTGTDYMLLAYRTVQSHTAATNKWKRPAIPNENSFAFYTPGAMWW